MIKKLILVCLSIVTVTSGGAIAATSYSKCCKGTACVPYTTSMTNCKSCLMNSQCGDGGILSCPDECPNSDWTLVELESGMLKTGPRYETRCVSYSCQYRCHDGSYGNPTSSAGGCTQCPTFKKDTVSWLAITSRASSLSGTTDITGCYIPLGTVISDTTGSFTYTDDCYYSE
ncbi:MAG: hypothetical protein NC311_00305 [Muribaculaceae bacterium]|nr:hypothetical protein [Muribaculaceae bacterium]